MTEASEGPFWRCSQQLGHRHDLKGAGNRVQCHWEVPEDRVMLGGKEGGGGEAEHLQLLEGVAPTGRA